MSRPAKIRIDLNALQKNQAVARRYSPNSRMLCCVKANAYGHGLVEAALVLAKKADALAVASLEEAKKLREAGVELPLLLLEGIFDPGELQDVEEHCLWQVVHNERQVQWLCEKEVVSSQQLWVKVDTGMHRLGFAPAKALEVSQALQDSGWPVPVLMTHFASAEEPESEFTRQQIRVFDEVAESMSLEQSLANSAAVIGWPETHRDWVRPGFMLYGLTPYEQDHTSSNELEPVMTFESEVIAVREIGAGESVGYNRYWVADRPSRIAIVAAGYGDGYPRNVKNGTPVLVSGQRAGVVGRVSMDLLSLDVTGLSNVEIGSKVELWGKNLSANEVARFSGYSAYELLTRMPIRVERIYQR